MSGMVVRNEIQVLKTWLDTQDNGRSCHLHRTKEGVLQADTGTLEGRKVKTLNLNGAEKIITDLLQTEHLYRSSKKMLHELRGRILLYNLDRRLARMEKEGTWIYGYIGNGHRHLKENHLSLYEELEHRCNEALFGLKEGVRHSWVCGALYKLQWATELVSVCQDTNLVCDAYHQIIDACSDDVLGNEEVLHALFQFRRKLPKEIVDLWKSEGVDFPRNDIQVRLVAPVMSAITLLPTRPGDSFVQLEELLEELDEILDEMILRSCACGDSAAKEAVSQFNEFLGMTCKCIPSLPGVSDAKKLRFLQKLRKAVDVNPRLPSDVAKHLRVHGWILPNKLLLYHIDKSTMNC